MFRRLEIRLGPIAIVGALLVTACAAGEHMHHADHMLHGNAPAGMTAAMPDTREVVHFPGMLYDHELANMRDHLATLQRLQAALAQGDYDGASHLAEERLGMSSMPLHGAHEVAPYMPQPMQERGEAMHRAASHFAVEAANVSATGDVKPALAALSDLTAQCVACHAAYRLEK